MHICDTFTLSFLPDIQEFHFSFQAPRQKLHMVHSLKQKQLEIFFTEIGTDQQ